MEPSRKGLIAQDNNIYAFELSKIGNQVKSTLINDNSDNQVSKLLTKNSIFTDIIYIEKLNCYLINDATHGRILSLNSSAKTIEVFWGNIFTPKIKAKNMRTDPN